VKVLGAERRRRWSYDEKVRLIEETLRAGETVCGVARRHGMAQSLLFTWRRQARQGRLGGEAVPALVPVEIASTPAPAPVFRDTLRSRAISLIVLPLMKWSRRIRAIVSGCSRQPCRDDDRPAGGAHFRLFDPANAQNGTVTWTFSPVDADLDFLSRGELIRVTAVVALDDGHGHTVETPVSINIHGADDAPTVAAIDAGTVAETAAPVTIDLLQSSSDPDRADAPHLGSVPTVVTSSDGHSVAADVSDHSVTIDPQQFAYLGSEQTTVTINFTASDGQIASPGTVKRIAVDAPAAAPPTGSRLSESELSSNGLSSFRTPAAPVWADIREISIKHLEAGGSTAALPYANKIWMLFGFELFAGLRKELAAEVLEVYPFAIIRALLPSCAHKSTPEGYRDQLAAVAARTGWEPLDLEVRLKATVSGNRHDRLDAFMAAWIASLPTEDRRAFGDVRNINDAIWVRS
jgi:VCBS repeat-containing protein